MKVSNDILNELISISPLLAGIEKTNVFTVPAGYFENLDETILAGTKENDIATTNGLSKDIVFEVPQGYFEGLSDKILGKIKALNASDELRTLSPMLYSIQNENLFEVPVGYFEGLPDKILGKIKAEQQLNALNELRVLSPMLYSIQSENVFEVPVGYFNAVADNILTKIKPQPAKVVVMHKRHSFFKYAAAAMITGVLGLGVYKFISKSNHGNIGQVTVASLDASIQNGIKMNAVQFNQALDTLSQDDIANYLDKNGSDADVAELSSNIDDNSLPSQDQYLANDSTLDNYINDNTANQKDN
jgi:hypothetical protein